MSSDDIHDPNGFQQDVQRAIEKVKEKAEDGDVSEQDRDDIMAYVNSKYQFVTSDDGLGPGTLRTRIGRLRIFAEATDKPLLDVDGRKEVSRIIGRMSRERGWGSTGTRKNYYKVLKGFYRYHERDDLADNIKQYISEEIDTPSKTDEVDEEKYPTPEEVGALMDATRTSREKVIVDPVREDEGWEFTPEKDGCTPDTVNGADYLREVYVAADPEYTGRVTVPVLWDTQEDTIVNNESIEIMRMFATAFDGVGDDGINLYPEGYREEIDRIIDAIYDSINNGVYRAGFAESQEAYDEAVTDVFDALDHRDEVLADQRYLAGDRLTLADVRMFPTLIRFDHCYHTAFKCDRQYLHQYENLWPYLRDLYQMPGVAETVRMDHIKDQGYYQGEITPIGPDIDFDAPHNRDRLSAEPSNIQSAE